MFSHKIVNPNSVEISNANFSAIPFGHRCTSALACRFANIRHQALPFDWTLTSFPAKMQRVLESNFEHYVPHVENGAFVNYYGIELAHFNKDIVEGIQSYIRRVNTFTQIMDDTTQSKYFVYVNEDYLYDPKYRDTAFLDTRFKEMLELETYVKQRYPQMNYGILYFDFKEHSVPPDSRIINIVLDTPKVSDEPAGNVYEPFRYYCGWMLSIMFKTTLNPPGYDFETIFNT